MAAFSLCMSLNISATFKGLSLSSSSSASFFKGGSSSFLHVGPTSFVSIPHRTPLTIQNAHKKGAGSTKNGRDSCGERLGVKIYCDQVAKLCIKRKKKWNLLQYTSNAYPKLEAQASSKIQAPKKR
ncbi:unnamed protein product [Lupinus luteus]|uniref:50S ribosomal protein L28, chloroplastic n=1 Tax=Lupinus luteus TaxID=3873 RepID=A0AAV1VZX2_LUPLU